MEKKQSRGVSFVGAVFSFLLCIGLTLCIALPVLCFSALSQAALLRGMEKSDFYAGTQAAVLQSASSLLVPTGLSGDVLDNVLQVEDVQGLVDGTLTGDEAMRDAAAANIRNRLRSNIDAYVANSGLPPEAIPDGAIDSIVNGVMESITNGSSFPAATRITSTLERARTLVVAGTCVGALLSILCAVLLIRLDRIAYRFLRHLAFAFFGSALMLLVVPAVGLVWGGHTRLGLSPEYLYNFVVQYVNNALWALVIAGGITLILAICVTVLAERSYGKQQRRVLRNEFYNR